jgi:hypothetical protein
MRLIGACTGTRSRVLDLEKLFFESSLSGELGLPDSAVDFGLDFGEVPLQAEMNIRGPS